MEKISPISLNERITAIDIIRGFAIFGIFIVNMQDFSSPWLYLDTGYYWKNVIDIGTQIFIDVFAQASFYTLFSFLFGFGMIIFMERAVHKGISFVPLFSRRLIVLFFIGILHVVFVWHGDILISYALIGFLLILFHQAGTKTLLSTALSLIIIPSTITSIYLYNLERNASGPLTRFNGVLAQKSIDIYSHGTYIEIMYQRLNDWLYVNGGLGYIFLIFSLLPMFLLGAFVAKKKLFHHIENHLPQIIKIWKLSFIVAIFFKLVLPYMFKRYEALFYLQDSIGGPATAMFYASSLILLTKNTAWRRRLSFFAAVGRLSLSNYLVQSIISTMIFYSYGFGLYGKVRPIYGLILTFIIFTIQAIISHFWLKKFMIGPAEWVWRSITYKKAQPFKIEESR